VVSLADEHSIGLMGAVPMPPVTVPRLACPSQSAVPCHHPWHPVVQGASGRALLHSLF